MILNLYKKRGDTPLETLSAYTKAHPEMDEPMTYAGRLDPIAEGVLPVLTGDAINRKQEYLGKEKVYRVGILFGYSSDTYDILGIPQREHKIDISKDKIQQAFENLQSRDTFPYPWYSSKTYEGKPLWRWAREGNTTIERPTRKMKLLSYEIGGISTFPRDELFSYISDVVQSVKGDFRQGAIQHAWKEILRDEIHTIYEMTLKVSSGTYVRTLADELGKYLGSGAVVFSLIRESVGEMKRDDSLRL